MAKLPPGVTIARPVGAPPEEPEPIHPSAIMPVPELLTEAQRRERISAAREVAATATAHAEAAQAALQRAQQHVESCRGELSSFDDIVEQLRVIHVEALRGDAFRPRIDLPDELRARLTARDEAHVALEAATAALPTFEREAEVARTEAGAKQIALSNAIDGLVAVHALALLAKRNEVAKQLEGLNGDVIAFEQRAGVLAPRAVKEFVLGFYATGGRVSLADAGPWRELHRRLAEDAQAPLELRPTVTAVQRAA
jgi:hypothetical protein